MSAATTAQRAREWSGPALFSFGFRPFFLFGAVYAAVTVALWIPWYLGLLELPTDWPPVAWHAHELLFGYVPAIIAGFLLTAVPNWTGRLPVVGWPLAGLFGVWLIGRVAVATAGWLGSVATTVLAVSFLSALILVIGREIVTGDNWRNLKVLVLVGVLLIAQIVFLWEMSDAGSSLYGSRLAIAATITLIMLVGGRIVPSFTGNWLRRRSAKRMPAPFSRFDVLAIATGVAALLAWALLGPTNTADAGIAVLAGAAAVLHAVRLFRWRPLDTLAEPLLAILHIGYAFVPLGFLFAALSAFLEDSVLQTATVHAWTAGAIGTMTLAVMTRATLGHTGRPLTASRATAFIYACAILAALSRIMATVYFAHSELLLACSATLWVFAFGGFGIAYGPMLASRR